MNNLKTLLTSLIVLLCTLTASAHDFEVDGIYYRITSSSDLTVAVTYRGSYYDSYSNEYTGSVVIPEKVTYDSKEYSVTSIGNRAFESCSGLTSVTIPNSVTSIGGEAFRDCSGLTSVTIPNSVTSIELGAFYHCSGLTSVSIPNSVTSIGIWAFNGCSRLTSVTIPNSVTSIGNSAFYGTGWYNNHSDGVLYLDNWLIDYKGTMPANTSINIKDGTKGIAGSAFYGCSGLTSVTIPNSVTSIGSNAFSDCSGLTSVTIPNSVTSIGSTAFEGCSGLTSVTIGNSVTSIGYSAFEGCSSLTNVSIPNSVTSIGREAFHGTGWYNNHSDGVLYLDNWLIDYKGTMPANTSINIKDGTKGIADNAFSDCSGLTSVTIPNSVTNIGNYAFDGCSGLTSVTIPNSVTNIGNYAFYDCSGLTSVAIGNSVTSIGDGAFYGCNSLYYVYNSSELDITKGATSHGYVAYYAKKVYNYEEIIDDYLFTTDEETGVHYLCGYAGNATELNLPKNYKGNNYCIADGAFRDCINITSVTIPNSVTSIGSSAFEGCSGLTSVHIKDLSAWCKIKFDDYDSNPTDYAHHLYLNGEEITNLVIPDDVTIIGDWAFRDCSGLTSVTIPNSVTSISKFGFFGCTGLTAIKVDSENTKYDSRDNCNAIIETETNTLITGCKNTVIPNSVTIIGEYAFYDLTGMPTITIPKSVEKICKGALGYSNDNSPGIKNINIEELSQAFNIKDDNGAFPRRFLYYRKLLLNGKEISELVIPEGVDTVSGILSGTNQFKSLVIPKTVKEISTEIFDICKELMCIYTNSVTPPAIKTNILFPGFSDNTYNNATLYVPKEGYDLYTSTAPWSSFANIKIFTNTTDVTLDKTSIKMVEGETVTLSATVYPEDATDKTITWTSSDENIAKVSETGVVTALKAGKVTITASSKVCPNVTATCEIIVNTKISAITLNKTAAEIVEGESLVLTATVSPEDATDKTVIWTSSDESIAKISENGVVTALKAGRAIITASSKVCPTVTATCEVVVKAKTITVTGITLDKITAEITEGETLTLTATVSPENATDKTVTWISSDESIAKVINGIVIGVKAGKATIIASCGDKVATCEITVNAKVIPATGIALDKTTAELTEGETLTLTATVTPEDATDKTVVWTSSDETVATVKDGVVTALKAGKATITAKAGEVSATCELTVNAKVIPATGITLDKTTAELTEGETLTLTATVSPEDATDKTVTWTSSDETVATVKDGVVTALKAGKVTITAKAGEVSATCEITVNAKVIPATGIALDKTTAEMIEGETLTLTATVSPEDATDKTVTWTSSDETVAKVVNGVVSALKTGKTTITATSGEVSATCEITVIPVTGINGVVCNDGYAAGNVYTVAGNLVCRKGEKLSSLPKGLYIVDGKKIVVK